MDLTRDHVYCSECGAQRINAGDGVCCPNGHGRVWPKIDPRELKRFLRQEKLAKYPEAKWVAPFPYRADGILERLRWVSWTGAEDMECGAQDGYVLARLSNRLAIFEKEIKSDGQV